MLLESAVAFYIFRPSIQTNQKNNKIHSISKKSQEKKVSSQQDIELKIYDRFISRK
jgi:hypothetical protein